MPNLAFMTDVKHIEACCEADQLTGKEMENHQEGGWQTFLIGSEPDGGPAGGESGDLGELSELLPCPHQPCQWKSSNHRGCWESAGRDGGPGWGTEVTGKGPPWEQTPLPCGILGASWTCSRNAGSSALLPGFSSRKTPWGSTMCQAQCWALEMSVNATWVSSLIPPQAQSSLPPSLPLCLGRTWGIWVTQWLLGGLG